MTFTELLAEVAARDVRLAIGLDVDLPVDVPDALVEALREHRPTLLMRLAREAQWAGLKGSRWPSEAEPTEPGIDRLPPAQLSRELIQDAT